MKLTMAPSARGQFADDGVEGYVVARCRGGQLVMSTKRLFTFYLQFFIETSQRI